MKKYSYNYETIIHFSSTVKGHCFKLRCIPCNNDFQRIISNEFQLLPVEKVIHDKDIFGNSIQYGTINDPHNVFVFISSGIVEQESYIINDEGNSYLFLPQTDFTHLEDNVFSIFKSTLSHLSNKDKATYLMKCIYNYMVYTPGVTDHTTTARKAFAEKKGVCQDYSHILIGLCRSYSHPAR